VLIFTTRGFAELFRFGRAFGARPETLTGLSGLGDLILTCASTQSRNLSLGIALGKSPPPRSARNGIALGKSPPPRAVRDSGKLAEGVFTAPILVEMANARGLEMPIASAVADILGGRTSVDEAIENLLTRPFRAEG